jgi:hypothetical protein
VLTSPKFPFFATVVFFLTLIPASESIALDRMELVPIKKITTETNLINIDITTYNPGFPNVPSVIAAKDNNLYIANRESSTISFYTKVEEKLIHVKDFNLPKSPESRVYILDIEPYLDKFLVSAVEYFDDIKSCSTMKLYELSSSDIFINRFISKPCVGGVGAWSEIAGRIAVNERKKLAFVTGGNILTDIYRNQFPRPGLCCIKGSYEFNMKNTNLFGSVISVNLKTNRSSKISVGHRGPQGIELDETRNIIYQTEHGPRGGDEINIIKSNHDYGWPFVTLGREYFSEFTTTNSGFGKAVKTNTHKGYTEPIFSWVPSIAPSQLQKVRKNSEFLKYWTNDLLVSTLKDKSIRRLHLSDNGDKVVYDEKIYIGERIRDIEPLEKGFVISFDSGLIAILSVSLSSVGGGPFPTVNN